MPELPEVNSVMLGLNQLVQGKTIKKARVYWPRIVGRETFEEAQSFAMELANQQIQLVDRRGKYLIFYLSDKIMISHLRMEGKYQYIPKDQIGDYQKDKHTHLEFSMTDGSLLNYHDVRKFGRIELIKKESIEVFFRDKKLGPEPIESEFKLEKFQVSLAKINRAIKPVLLEQKVVAGLGNIYVDESLFRAGIHPSSLASSIPPHQIKRLHQSIIQVIAEAVEAGGSSIRTYRNTLGEAGKFQHALKVYGRKGQPCVNCGSSIEKIQLAQRGTHYCPNCQKIYC
ncbi:DNA-formamidopyrimidine glycosylase [Facklamia miroungae]|uniref:Formamidopyrimidine-DNA glycosylase n=1 Tax=Facklamia miroungae TaxID=120956 RepID=A0A1G7TLR0_9LACT|nr:DNA-formamidopyrimidine glycosylase [Facklamia miroungae]NKZ29786.1 DNA-formamidopyrimidine glycosylase [Facklamia miroungae]SDG36141.1 formamidopyrimidine-DNA glycosylase [Facklamia miroungae]